MSETLWAALLGAAAGAMLAFLAGERQRINVYKAQIWDEARREIAPKLDAYGYWLVELRRVFLELTDERGAPPTHQALLAACAELGETDAARELHAQNIRALRYYRVALPQYSVVADDLLAAHARLGEMLDMAWLYFRSDVSPTECGHLSMIAVTALAQYAVLIGHVRDSVLDDVLQPVFHPFAGRWHIAQRQRAGRRLGDVDFKAEPYPRDWDSMALKFEDGKWRFKDRLLLFHPDLEDRLDADWDEDDHGPREGTSAG